MRKMLFIFFTGIILIGCQKDSGNNSNNSNGSTSGTNHSCGAKDVHNPNKTYGKVTDIDGNAYKTIQIGTQTWMAENLKVTKYRNGVSIPNITDAAQWTSLKSGAWCSYLNNNSNDCPNGKMYNWYAAINGNNICPEGWHIPSDNEWKTLSNYLGGEYVAGGAMKTVGTTYWMYENVDATNSSGFSALPSGGRYQNGNYNHLRYDVHFWTSTEENNLSDKAFYRDIDNYSGMLIRKTYPKYYGFYIRCLQDYAGANITSLNCSSIQNNGTLIAGTAATGVSSVIPYTGGNGGSYGAQTINSTGVTGLTATLAAGTLANGAGTLTYTITGTASGSGTASFTLSIGGQTCTLNRTVIFGVAGITAHTCGAANLHNATIPYGTMTDQQGNVYKTVQIGAQTWMAENLRTTVYRNNTPIQNITDATQWKSNTNGAFCSYENITSNDCPYGKLYNWYAVMNTNQLCPIGWHVPTDNEWTILTTFLGGESNGGGKMKSTGTQYWQSPNSGASNSSGFSGIPAGGRNYDGAYFKFIGLYGSWWSTTESVTNHAWHRRLGFDGSDLYREYNNKNFGFSVRCVRD